MRSTALASVLMSLLLAVPLSAAPLPAPATPARKPLTLPGTFGEHLLNYKITIDGHRVEMVYEYFLPRGYETGKDKYPMLLFLHGAGECGSDGGALKIHGPPQELENPVYRDSFPFILLAPQCPPQGQRWDQDFMYKAVVELVKDVEAAGRVDADRVYITGLSMGGKGTYFVAMQAPELFAAIAPVAVGAIHPEVALQRLKYIPVWSGTGEGDDDTVNGTKQMLEALKGAKAEARSSLIPGAGHDCWDQYYQNTEMYEWLLQHHRLSDAERRDADLQATPSPWPPTAPGTAYGEYFLYYPAKSGNYTLPIEYSLYLSQPKGDKRPLLVYLHEPEHFGLLVPGGKYIDGSTAINSMWLSGPELEVAKPGSALAASFPFVALSPRLPPGKAWDQDDMQAALLALVQNTIKTQKLDPARVYITGCGAGGTAAWTMTRKNPKLFASAALLVTDAGFVPGPADLLHLVPAWTIIPARDQNQYQFLADLIRTSRSDSLVTRVAAADMVKLPTVYSDPKLYAWLLTHKRADVQ